MALIEESIFQALIDSLAEKYKALDEVIPDLSNASPTLFQIITTSDDPDVEVPLEVYADFADRATTTNAVILKSFSKYLKLINSMNTHFTRVGFAGGYDQYLINKDLRASNYFNQLYICAVNQALLAKNVFCDDDFVFGTIDLTSGPAISYDDEGNFGNGTIANRRATDGNFAATQLKILVNTFSGVRCDLNITGLDAVGDVITTSVIIPANADEGDYIDIGDANDRYLDVGTVTFTSGSNHGTASDQFVIYNKIERVI